MLRIKGGWDGLKVEGEARGLRVRGEGCELVSDNFSQSSRQGIVTIPIVTNYAGNNMAYSFLLNGIELHDYVH